ncbi:MAG: sugar transferase [Candidatus Auribacterota bacterium]
MSDHSNNNNNWHLSIVERKFLLLWCDFIIVFGAIFLAVILRSSISMDLFLQRGYFGIIFLYTSLTVAIFYIIDLYNIFLIDFWTSIVPRIFIGVALTSLLVIVSSFFLEFLALPRKSIVFMSVVIILGMMLTRYYLMIVKRYPLNIMVLGSGFAALKMIEDIKKSGSAYFHIIGIYDDDDRKHGKEVMEIPIRGGIESFAADIKELRPQMVVVSFEKEIKETWTDILLQCARSNVQVSSAVDIYCKLFGKVPSDHIDALWLLSGIQLIRKPYFIFKRFCDIIFSLIGLFIMLLIFPFVFVIMKITSPGPIFFSQVRVGLNGSHFRIHKFRTMVVDAEKRTGAVWATKGDNRITAFGKFMRKVRIDELPQFWNILKGDMSIVGPRPERPEFVDMLKERITFYDERHLVKPGLTGWAQVLYPYGNTIEDATEKLHYDLFYIRNMSVFMDMKIILKTIATVIGGRGGM